MMNVIQRKNYVYWFVGIVSVVFLYGHPAGAVNGSDCGKKGGSCLPIYSCESPNKETSDCEEIGTTCCLPPPESSTQAVSTKTTKTDAGYVNFRLQLPSCTAKGDCTVQDIVMTGVAFANLLMTLSGAFFFAAFVYGGGMWVMSFGRSDWVSKGKTAMINAAIGMVIVLSAWTIVKYVVSSLVG